MGAQGPHRLSWVTRLKRPRQSAYAATAKRSSLAFMVLRGLRPSPLGLPAHHCPPCRNRYIPTETHTSPCAWVEMRGVEPLSRTPPDCRNYNHAFIIGARPTFVKRSIDLPHQSRSESQNLSGKRRRASHLHSALALTQKVGVYSVGVYSGTHCCKRSRTTPSG